MNNTNVPKIKLTFCIMNYFNSLEYLMEFQIKIAYFFIQK